MAKVNSHTRHTAILSAASSMAIKAGLNNIKRDVVAKHAKVATGTVSYHFKSMDALRDKIVSDAIQNENVPLLAKAMAEGHPAVKNLPVLLKRKVALHIAG